MSPSAERRLKAVTKRKLERAILGRRRKRRHPSMAAATVHEAERALVVGAMREAAASAYALLLPADVRIAFIEPRATR